MKLNNQNNSSNLPNINKFKNTAENNNALSIHADELKELLRFYPNPEARNGFIIFLVGVLFTPITLAGALFGYVRGFNRFMRPIQLPPFLHPMLPIVRVAMIIGAIAIWVVLFFAFVTIFKILGGTPEDGYFILGYLAVNTLLSVLVIFVFWKWQNKTMQQNAERRKSGSARFATPEELAPYIGNRGYYVGGGYTFNDKGHLFTIAGTRGGKGTNIIIPNLLGAGNYQGSWVIIDPKGENAMVTWRYQRTIGREVVFLNPWGLFTDTLGKGQSFNPLDILDIDSVNLVDDVQMIAEMIVPINPAEKDKFFTDNARSIITGLILHIIVNMDKEDQHLGTLWQLVRLESEEWFALVAEMEMTRNPVHREILLNAAREIKKLQAAGEKAFGSIISTVLQCTDFLKSPALRKALMSGYDPRNLAEGNSCIYIIIPADKLRSHAKWLRLMVTTTMRMVVRKPKERVTFLLDEFAALGYLPEIETALSTYAGFNISVWPILQDLTQLKSLYGNNWETFIANTAVKQYFNINDNFSAKYVSDTIGMTTHFTGIKTNKDGDEEIQTNPRSLVTPDEVRRTSMQNIIAFIGDAPATIFEKKPYYEMPELNARADKNPYFKE